MDIFKHSHPYINDFHELMKFDTEFDTLKQIQGNPKEAPLILTTRGLHASEEILADGFSHAIGLRSIYRNRAIDETMNIVRAITRRLSELGHCRSKRKPKLKIKDRNFSDFAFDLSKEKINQHRCAKLTIDLVDKFCPALK